MRKAFVVLVAALAGCGEGPLPPPPPVDVVLADISAPIEGAEYRQPASGEVTIEAKGSAKSSLGNAVSCSWYVVSGTQVGSGCESSRLELPVGRNIELELVARSSSGAQGRAVVRQSVYPRVSGTLVSGFAELEPFLSGMAGLVKAVAVHDSFRAENGGNFAVSSWATKSGSFEFSVAGGQKFFGLEGTVSSADAGSVNAFMVPRCVPLNSGEFAGQCVPVDLLACFKVASDGYSYCPVNWWDKTKPAIRGWADLPELPLKIVFDHQKTHRQFTAEDSVTFWEIIRENESRLDGIRFVESSYTGRVAGTISVMKDSTTDFSFAPSEVDSRNLIQKCTLQMGAKTGNSVQGSHSVSHELGHCLGLDHLAGSTCPWLSAMSRDRGCHDLSEYLSAHDVAYIKLMNAEAKARRDKNTRFGLGEAWVAEKRRVGG